MTSMNFLVNLLGARLTNRYVRILVALFLLGWGGGAVVGAGTCLCLWGVRTYMVLVWPRTTGLVRESFVVSAKNGRGAKLHFNALSVEYTIGGMAFRASRLYPFGNGFSSTKFMHESRRDVFPVGSKVEVYYNPSDQQDSFIWHIGLGELLWGMIPLVLLPLGVVALRIGSLLVFKFKDLEGQQLGTLRVGPR